MIHTDTEAANAALVELYKAAARQECHVTGGRVRIPCLVPGTALVVHELHPVGDVDVEDMRRKGVIYKASFLRTLANTAGIRMVRTQRMDDDTDPHLRDVEVAVEVVDLLLRRSQLVGRYELDLRDGSDRAQGMQQGMLKSKREHISSLAATGAYCRAIVEALAIRRGFKSEERNLAWLPVYVPRVEVHAASAPPDMLAAMSMAAIQQIYGLPPQPVAHQALPSPPAVQALPFAPASGDLGDDMIDVGADPDTFGGADDEVPFADDTLPEDVPPPEDDSRPITDQEQAHLQQIGCWKRSVLKGCGWSEDDGRPTLAVYRKAIEMFGGAPV